MVEKKKSKLTFVDWFLIVVLIATVIVCIIGLLGDKSWVLYNGFVDFLKHAWFYILGLLTGGR